MTLPGAYARSAWAPGTLLWRWREPVLVAGAAAAVIGLVGVVDPHRAGHYPACPFLLITGYYCPGCGSLRAIHDLAHGHLLEAVDRNPLLVAVLPFLLTGYLGWARRRIWRRARSRQLPAWAPCGLLVVMMVFWVLRNLPGFAWLAP